MKVSRFVSLAGAVVISVLQWVTVFGPPVHVPSLPVLLA